MYSYLGGFNKKALHIFLKSLVTIFDRFLYNAPIPYQLFRTAKIFNILRKSSDTLKFYMTNSMN